MRFLFALVATLVCAVPGRADDRLLREERFSEAFREAITTLSWRLDSKGALDAATISVLERVGVLAHLGGDQRTADEVLDAALAARRRLPRDDAALVRTLLARGRAARYRDRRAIAKACYDEAEKVLRGIPAAAASLRADLLQEQGDFARRTSFPEAIALYRRALTERRRASSGPSLETADTLTWLAWMVIRGGRTEEAISLAREARAMLGSLELPDHTLGATLAGLLADEQELAGHPERAVPYRREQAAIGEKARAKQLGGFARRRLPLDGYDQLALAALERGQGEEAWTLLERGRGAAHADFATLNLWERRDPASWAVARRTRAELNTWTRRLPAGGQEPAWSPGTAAVFVRVLDLRARLYDLERRYLQAHRSHAPTRAAVEDALGPKRALVGWVTAEVGELDAKTVPVRSAGYAYVLRPGRPVAWVPLWDATSPAEFRHVTREFSRAWELIRRAASWESRVDRDLDLERQLQAWGIQRFEPLLPHLRGVEHVVLESNATFEDLLRLRDGTSVGDHFDVSYVPSGLVLQLLAEGAANPVPLTRALTVSGPTDPGPATVAALVNMTEQERSHREFRSAYRRDGTPLESLPRLRFAGVEARAVGSKFPRPLVVTEPDSVEHTLDGLADRDGLRQFGVVHLAGHTLTDLAPERCGLALGTGSGSARAGDGIVETEDILLGWDLEAELLTLSGCETLRAAGMGRGEPLGFGPALFGSGARRILSSVWTVDDRATAVLMDRFYENLTGGYRGVRMGYRQAPMPAARALREAKAYIRTLEDSAGRRPFEHPAYWGGFMLMGLP